MIRDILAWAVVGVLVAGNALAAADTCTFTASGNWSAIGTHPATTGCDNGGVIEAADTVVIPSGITITIAGDVTQSTGSITVQTGGELRHAGGGTLYTLAVGNGGLTSSGTFYFDGDYATIGTAPTLADSPSPLTYWQYGDYTGCGAGPDCTKAQVQWPAATYDTGSGGTAMDTGIDTSLNALAAGDIISFWNPSGASTFGTPDINACYPITSKSTTQLEYTVRLAPNLPVPAAHQDIITGTTTGDATKAATTVTVPAGTFTSTTIYGAVGKWLRFQDGGGAYEAQGYQILRVTDGGGGDDTITLADPRGFQATYASGATFSIDYGWQRGDPFIVYRPAKLRCATDYGCTITLNGVTHLKAVHLSKLKKLEIGGAGYVHSKWQDVFLQEAENGATSGVMVTVKAAPAGADYTFDRTCVIGGDAAGGASEQTQHGFGTDTSGSPTIRVTNSLLRWIGDDAFVTGANTSATFNVTRSRVQWYATNAASANLFDGNATPAAFSSFIADGLDCIDCTGSGTASNAVFSLHNATSELASRVSVNGLMLFGVRGAIANSQSFSVGPPTPTLDPETYVSIRNVMILGGGQGAAASSNWSLPVMEDFVVRGVANPGTNNSFHNDNISYDALHWKNGLFTENSQIYSYAIRLSNAGTRTSEIDNVAFIDNENTATTPELFYLSNVKDGSVFENITVAQTSSFTSASGYLRAFDLQDSSPTYTLRNVLLTGLTRATAVGLVMSGAGAFTGLTDRNGWMFFRNTTDFTTITNADLLSTSARGRPVNLLDPQRKLMGVQAGSLPALYGSGADVRAGITRYQWFHAIHNLEPENLGTLGGGSGNTGWLPRAF